METCVQIIGHPKTGRKCSMKAVNGWRCHKHQDQSLYARVSYRTGHSKGKLDEITAAFVDEMGWDEVKAFNAEIRRGQLYDDAGGYLVRCIGKLFGARGRFDQLSNHRRRLANVFNPTSQGEPK